MRAQGGTQIKIINSFFSSLFTTSQHFVHQIPTTNQTTNNMNKHQIGTLWVVATIIDTAILIALCVTVGLVW